MNEPERMTHAVACHELRRVGALFATGELTRDQWYERVTQILDQRFPSARYRPPALAGARP